MPTHPAPQPLGDVAGEPTAPESVERAAAVRRAAARASGHPVPPIRHPTGVAALAFRALADGVRDYAIFLLDPDGVITLWGEGARLMKWWSKAEAEGGHLRMLYPDGGSEDGTAEDHLREAAERGESTGEGHRVRAGGSTFYAGVTLTALRDEAGTLLGFAKVTRDLTAQRASEAVLRAASEAAEEARVAAESANRAKSGFLATMSHEIRTPVNAIIGYQDLLELEVGGPLTLDQRQYLERARASGRHLLSLIDDVLDLSRLEADRVTVDRAVVRVGNVVDAAISLLAPQAQARGIALTDSVSGRAAALNCWGDAERVRQILVNLLSNAIKFTPGGGRVTVSAGLAESPTPDAQLAGPGPWAYVRVEDTGQGIPAGRIGAVFEPFVQADMSHTRVHGGTGLGLAISRRLARLMGGDIVGRSEVGVGSTFFLWLRAAPAVPQTATKPETGVSGGALVPDAEHANRRALRDIADALLGEIERILHAYVARLRSDPLTPSARRADAVDLEDHLATFLADVTQSLTSLDAVGDNPDEALRDGSAIQRVVAERHGRQRARLGWQEGEVRRELQVLGEELAAGVLRRAPRDRVGADGVEEALAILRGFLEAAERASLESFAAARRQIAGG